MKLIKAHIQHFRNIIDSGKVGIDDQVTCLVGKNESGKTSFLHALYRLLPARTNVSFDAPSQYPAWLEKKHRQSGIDIDSVKPATAVFQVEPEDLEVLEEHFGPGTFTSETVTVTRDYNPQGQPVAVLDELKIRIRDNRHWLTLPFNEHSTGFQWFFSFLAAFSKFEWSKEPLVKGGNTPGRRINWDSCHDRCLGPVLDESGKNTLSELLRQATMTQNSFRFTKRLLMVLSVALSLALVIYLEVTP